MTVLYRFIRAYEALIYIVLAIGGLFAFRWLWHSWRESQTAVYRLEREFSARRLAQSVAVSVFVTALFCVEFFIASFILPGLPANSFGVTFTPDLISTPTGTLSAAMMTQFAPPPAAAMDAQGCAPGQVFITAPESGDEVSGVVELLGAANAPNFGFYKLESAPQGGANWAIFSAGSTPVKNGLLGRWDTAALTPGDYQLRLVVTDNQGAALPACAIYLRVAPLQ